MTGYKTVVGMVNGMMEELNITVPVALHLDHGHMKDAKSVSKQDSHPSCSMVLIIH